MVPPSQRAKVHAPTDREIDAAANVAAALMHPDFPLQLALYPRS